MGAAIAIAVGVWWTANTVSHIFIHRPFFRRRAANAWFAVGLTAALGFPQSWWRDRHLAHHRGAPHRFRLSGEMAMQTAIVGSIWIAMALAAPVFFVSIYLPGYVGGLLLCAVHGHFEHAGGTTSHYGWLYNTLCFNDGYHVEHHRHPSARWQSLPVYREATARASAWPAPLRWVESNKALTALERLVLHSRRLQRWLVGSHARAFAALLARKPRARHVAIVGGGLFPRTALILRDLLPEARLTIVDASAPHLDRARAFLQDDDIVFVNARFTNQKSNLESRLRSQSLQASDGEARRSAFGAEAAELCYLNCDVLIFPLSYDGDRSAVYAHPPAPMVLVHDWIWHKRGDSRIVSWLLLKRVNLVSG